MSSRDWVLGLLILLAGVGAGCAPPTPMACEWIPQADIEKTSGIPIGSLQQAGTSTTGLHTCTYADQNGKLFFSVSDDAETPAQFISNIRNLFPTSAQPEVTQNLGVGDASVLVHFHNTAYLLYVRSGANSYILSNISNSGLGKDGLVSLAADLVSRMK